MTKLRFLLYWLLSFGTVWAQDGKFPLNITAKDAVSGFQIEAKYLVKSTVGGAEAKIETKGGITTAYLRTGEKYQIIANGDGYKEEKIFVTIEPDADPKQPRAKIVNMTPVASAQIALKAIDAKTNQVIAAHFDVAVPDLLKNQVVETTTEKTTGRLTLTGDKPKAKVFFKAIAEGYEIALDTLDIEILDPPKQYNVAVKIRKQQYNLKINVKDRRENPIPRLKVTIREVGAVNPMKVLTDPQNGTIDLVLKYGRSYRVLVEAPGYNSQEKTYIDRDGESEIGIRLDPKFEAYYKIKATDGRNRIGANIKISNSKVGVVAEVSEFDTTTTVKITQKGVYKIEANAKGYQNVIDDLLVEDTNAGVTSEKILTFEKAIKEYVLKVVNKKDGSPIVFSDVKLKTADGKAVNIKKIIQSNEYSAVLKDEEVYQLEATAPDFETLKEPLKKLTDKQIVIALKEKTRQLHFTAIDKYTKKPVAGVFKIAMPEAKPLEGRTQADGSRFTVVLPSSKTYPLEVTAKDYKEFKMDFVPEDLGKDDLIKIEIEKIYYPFRFWAIDSETDKRILNAQFKFSSAAKDSSDVERTNDGTGEQVVSLDLSKTYEMEVIALGYESAKQNVNLSELLLSGFKKDIPLKKKIYSSHKLVFVDEETKKAMKTVEVVVKNSKTTVESSKASSSNEIVFTPVDGESYSFVATADGYQNISEKIALNTTKLYTYGFKKLPTTAVNVYILDAITKKEVVADLSLLSNKKEISTNKGSSLTVDIRNGLQYELDIKAKGYLPNKQPLVLEKVVDNKVVIELRKDQYVFTIKAVDATTKEKIEDAKMVVTNITKPGIVKPKDEVKGEVFIDLKPEFVYEVRAEKAGYDATTVKIDMAVFTNATNFNLDVPLTLRKEPLPVAVTRKYSAPPPVVETKSTPPKPAPKKEIFEDLKVGKVILLESVYFDQGSYILKKESEPQLNKLFDALKSQPHLKIEIAGHTDNQGNEALNRTLSLQRATVLANYLFNKGIQDNRIAVAGYGSAKGISSNDSEENRAKNRRVEVTIKEY